MFRWRFGGWKNKMISQCADMRKLLWFDTGAAFFLFFFVHFGKTNEEVSNAW